MADKTYIVENANNPIESDFYKDIIQKDANGNPLVDSQNRIRVKRYVVHGSVGLNEASVDSKLATVESRVNATITDLHHVTTDTTQTVSGNKTFTGETRVPTVDSSDSSTKAASTAFVQGKVIALQNTLNTFLDSDDATLDQASELVAAIKANKIDIASLVTDIGKLIDPVSHLPIKATTASVGVVQLATAQDITNGTANKVVDAQELNNFVQTLPSVNGVTDVSSGDNSNQLVISRIGGSKTLTIDNVEHAGTATSANSVAWDNVSGKPSTFTPSDHDHPQINQLATGLTNLMGINNGNDYFNPRDITNLIYDGNGAGTLRAQIAQGDFRNVHPGDYIIGRSTGTKWIVAHNDYWFNRGDSPLTTHHLCLIPEILAGNSGNLLWSGRTYAGSGVNNSNQGYAPWASDNWSEGKNNTSGAYYNSFMKQSILPKVYTYWLKKDFEDQGISLLTFRNLLSDATNTNAPVKGYSAWTGASSSWAWYDSKCDLLSEANVYGNNHWQSSGFDCGAQKEQFALFKFRHTLEVWGRRDVWFQDVASSSYACVCNSYGYADYNGTSGALVVAPFCLIA